MLLSTLGSATMKRSILGSQWMPPIVFGGRFALKSHPKGPLPINVPVLVSSTFIVARYFTVGGFPALMLSSVRYGNESVGCDEKGGGRVSGGTVGAAASQAPNFVEVGWAATGMNGSPGVLTSIKVVPPAVPIAIASALD